MAPQMTNLRARRFWRAIAFATASLSAIALILFCAKTQAAPRITWIDFRDGHLIYGSDEKGNRIPDFSSAGYEGGGVPIPSVPVAATLDPVSSGDDTPRIQLAIDDLARRPLAQNGFRGALLLRAGAYRIASTIDLDASGIILRGEGTGANATILIAEGQPRTLIRVTGDGSWQPAGVRHNILDAYVPVGANSLTIDDHDDLKPGDRVIVEWAMDANFIHSIGMDRIPPRPDGQAIVQWQPGMGLKFDRRIVAVDHTANGERITLDAPLTTVMQSGENPVVWRYTFPGRIDHVGIENLRTQAAAFEKTPNFGTPETRDAQGRFVGGGYFDALFAEFDSVENAWMRDVVVSHYTRIVSIDQFARAITVERIRGIDITIPETSASPHAFGIDGQESLIQDCSLTGAYNHVWMTQSRVAGPNVFRNCQATGPRLDAGSHERWATGTLYENLKIQGEINILNRSNMGSGHGWSGVNNVLWNCETDGYVLERPAIAFDWAFGVIGPFQSEEQERRERRRGTHVAGTEYGFIISPGKHVQPESLYTEQLKERLSRSSDAR